MKVLHGCIKTSSKIFTIGLRADECVDGEVKEAFVSQCHSNIPSPVIILSYYF